jgi:hypothetical protein
MKTLQKGRFFGLSTYEPKSLEEFDSCTKTAYYLLRNLKVDTRSCNQTAEQPRTFTLSDSERRVVVNTLPFYKSNGDVFVPSPVPAYDFETWDRFNSVKVGDLVDILLVGGKSAFFSDEKHYNIQDLTVVQRPVREF